MGIYGENFPEHLRWLSQFSLAPGSLEQRDLFAPGYEPQLGEYIDALVQFRRAEKWTNLKRVKILFPNKLVRYLLIRSFARHNRFEELRAAVSEYLAQENPVTNVELAFYAAKAGIQPSEVTAIAGTIETPRTECPDYLSRSDPTLMVYAYSFMIIGYEENEESYEGISAAIGTHDTLWLSALNHLLLAGRCIGLSLRSDDNDWYEESCRSISILLKAKEGDGERTCDSIELIRDVLPLSIGILTERVETRYPERLQQWVTGLQPLRDSWLWTTHFGIGESIQDYNFELTLWETLAKSPAVRPVLIPILRGCAATYESSTMLKGGSRCDHFLRLAALMARCGMRTDAENWLLYGIRSSLTYGYHKDSTLLYLIDVVKLVNKRQPHMALERCARVLSMVDWMPHLTDNSGTKWFVEKAFEAVLAVDRHAAFDLLRYLSRTTARWQMQDCLESYLLTATEGDPEYLWCLAELFSNHFSDDGRHSKQILGTREHIVDLVRQSCTGDVGREFADRLRQFVLTEVPPRHWPQDLRAELDGEPEQNGETSESKQPLEEMRPDYTLDGGFITKRGVVARCTVSFSVFLETIEKLKKQNKTFYEPLIVDRILKHHIASATASSDLLGIKEYAESQGRWQSADVVEALAERFLEFGDRDNANACFGLAYACYGNWFRWQHSRKYLAAVAEANMQAAEQLLLNECYASARATGEGYDTPPIAAEGLDVLAKPGMLEEVFTDFLSHCESMFAQLPHNDHYAWLKQYQKPSQDERHLILDFVMDELETLEIDRGERLVKALTRLSIARPEATVPLIVTRALDSSGRVKRRLLMVIHCLANEIPEYLTPHQQAIARLLNQNDFFSRQTALRVLKRVSAVAVLDEAVVKSMHGMETAYSKAIYYSTFRLPTSPSPQFTEFLQRNTLFDFRLQIKMVAKILRIPPPSLIAAIEERLQVQGWSIDEERDRVKDDWDGHVHPQGWPVVWITTGFQELATQELWIVLDEVAQKLKLAEDQIDKLWCAIQGVDPEYISRVVMARPRDITPLHVKKKDEWFNELERFESMQVVETKTEEDDRDWITVCEKRTVAEEAQYNVPYRQEISLASFLIPLRVYGGPTELDEADFMTERFGFPDPFGAITLEQARSILRQRASRRLHAGSQESIPLIAVHQNPITFLGYRTLSSLASFIIAEFDLSFVGFDLEKEGRRVTVYEAWQEGYQDESYTREKLSFGVRLRVRKELLAEICTRYERVLCTLIEEQRAHFLSVNSQVPDGVVRSRRYILRHF